MAKRRCKGGWMICWSSACWDGTEATRGKAALVRWPDYGHVSDEYDMTSGACESDAHGFTPVELRHFVMSTALGMILSDGLEPKEVHRALWPLAEYRDALPLDVTPPEGCSPDDPAMPMLDDCSEVMKLA